jgi:hypothetical protein
MVASYNVQQKNKYFLHAINILDHDMNLFVFHMVTLSEFEQLQICKKCNNLVFCEVYPIEEQSKMWPKNLQYTAQDYLKQLNMSYN